MKWRILKGQSAPFGEEGAEEGARFALLDAAEDLGAVVGLVVDEDAGAVLDAAGLGIGGAVAQAVETRRGDGGYTLAISGRGRVDPTPQKVRFAREFVPMFVRRWRSPSSGPAPCISTSGAPTQPRCWRPARR